MNNLKKKDVLSVILDIAQSIRYRGLMLNERYLHHFFSHQLQNNYPLLKLNQDDIVIFLHPEWPTYKKQTGLAYGRYKKESGIYKLNSNGSAGFIDFAIGDYNKPDIAIEFSLKYGWSHEEIIYDFLKLLDKNNPFSVSISFDIIFRKRGLVKGGYLENLIERMNNAFNEAVNRLNINVCDESRKLYFIVTEIDKEDYRRHWHYDRKIGRFIEGLPLI